jgi:DNA-binding MarR family transcriptional regulator
MASKSTAGTSDQTLTDAPVFMLILAASLLARFFIEKFGPEHDLTLPEIRCLIVLQAESLSNRQVSNLTGIEPMSVSRALARLQRRGRVKRSRDPGDSRLTLNQLTARGQILLPVILECVDHLQQAMLEGMMVKELELFDGILRRVVKQLRAID